MPAVNDPNYRYATQTWDADGIQNQYEISFDGGYIRQEDVVAYSVLVEPVPGTEGLTYDRRVEALTFVSESGTTATVQVLPTVEVGRRLIIMRSTQKSSPMVSYGNNSLLTNENLDLANKQAIFAIAEIMDGLNTAGIRLDTTVQQVVDMNTLIQTVYDQVISLLNQSGIIGVKPLVWPIAGDGDTTDFDLPGADLDDASFYDVYVSGLGQQPLVGFNILPPVSGSPYAIRLATAPADGSVGFVVLRGSAKPYDGGTPLTVDDVRTKMIDVASTTYLVEKAAEFAMLRCLSASDTTVTIGAVAIGSDVTTVLQTGSYFSVAQRNSGQVTIVADAGVNLILPAGCLAKTRGANSTISATCEDIDTNTWILGGDLAKET